MAPSATAGIPVRDQVVTLGVPFAGGGDLQPGWGGGTSTSSQPSRTNWHACRSWRSVGQQERRRMGSPSSCTGQSSA
eukprot:216229-Chlamydomonas_euryale.AAC.1